MTEETRKELESILTQEKAKESIAWADSQGLKNAADKELTKWAKSRDKVALLEEILGIKQEGK